MAVANLAELGYQLDDLVFGAGTEYCVEDIEVGSPEIISNDRNLPRADGIRFGRDWRTGRTITFTIVILAGTGPVALNLHSALEAAWLGDGIRQVPGAVSVLRLSRGGRTRRVYGRARRFATAGEADRAGWLTVTCDFQTIDHLFYGDIENMNTVQIIPELAGGLLAPLAAPLGTLAISRAPGEIIVAGSVGCWPVFVIEGPIVNPVVEVVGEYSFQINRVVRYDEFIVIDPRPWSRGIRLNNYTSIAGAIAPGSPRLSDITLSPGPHEIVLQGADETGTARMTVAWRDAFASF